jgi:alpha-tubulin suppressor-like RCC1 family protein
MLAALILLLAVADTAPPAFAAIFPGLVHSCALTADGQAWCWGLNQFGQVGIGRRTTGEGTEHTAVPVATTLRFRMLALGALHTCGLTSDGTVFCWGDNTDGRLGDGTNDNRLTPTPVKTGLQFVAISSRNGTTCALTAEGAAWCWGLGDQGQLGVGGRWERRLRTTEPVAVAGPVRFNGIQFGTNSACGLSTDARLYCWGMLTFPNGKHSVQTSPWLASPDSGWSAVAVMDDSICALRGTTIQCWGANRDGEIGDGSYSRRKAFTPVATDLAWTALASGWRHACALDAQRHAWCWGSNYAGQLGTGERPASIASRKLPAVVLIETAFVSLAAAGGYTCGLDANGVAYCWGDNGTSQLGDGDWRIGWRATPAAVRAQDP